MAAHGWPPAECPTIHVFAASAGRLALGYGAASDVAGAVKPCRMPKPSAEGVPAEDAPPSQRLYRNGRAARGGVSTVRPPPGCSAVPLQRAYHYRSAV